MVFECLLLINILRVKPTSKENRISSAFVSGGLLQEAKDQELSEAHWNTAKRNSKRANLGLEGMVSELFSGTFSARSN